MKNKKKIFFINRIKCFYMEPKDFLRNGIKDEESNAFFYTEEPGDLNSRNPEEDDDFS